MPVILDNKNPSLASVFHPAALLREARRQKRLPTVEVPAVCILDPDGDIVQRLRKDSRSNPFDGWPCYHTQLDAFELGEQTVGIIGCAVGAPFAVLVAEELFECGCRLLLSLTSAGQIAPDRPPPYFVVIDRALRRCIGIRRSRSGVDSPVRWRAKSCRPARHCGSDLDD
jgi:hypothetical protein